MASMPATRAAVTTWTRAKCQKSPGYSLTGSKFPSTRACWEADRSPAPKMSASSRSLARPISTALASPSASSISTSRPMRFWRPSLASNWVRRTSTHQTSRAERAFGTMRTSSASRAPGDDLDDVVVAPDGVQAVDPNGPDGPAPVLVGERGHRDRPGSDLGRRGAGVLEVEEHQVGPGRRCLRAHLLAAGRRGQLGAPGPGLAHQMTAVDSRSASWSADSPRIPP